MAESDDRGSRPPQQQRVGLGGGRVVPVLRAPGRLGGAAGLASLAASVGANAVRPCDGQCDAGARIPGGPHQNPQACFRGGRPRSAGGRDALPAEPRVIARLPGAWVIDAIGPFKRGGAHCLRLISDVGATGILRHRRAHASDI